MKKVLLGVVLAFVLLIGGCVGVVGLFGLGVSEELENIEVADNEVEAEEATETEEVTEEEEATEEANVETEDELIYTVAEPFSLSKGDVNVTLLDGNLSNLYIDEERYFNFIEVEEGDIIPAVTLNFEVENTVEEQRDFYLGQTTIVTSNGEQIESEWLESSGLESEMLGAITSTGQITFLLSTDTPEEVEWIDIIIPSVSDENWDTLAEEEKVRIEFK